MQANIHENKKTDNTMVVDITYFCDATCKYCQWGNSKTPGRVPIDLDKILIPRKTLENLKTNRIVISGGEPRLHPHLSQIIKYYEQLVNNVIIMTNGYGLTMRETKKLLQMGITGITISLDSIDSMESFLTRSTHPKLHKEILENLENISNMDRNFELSINSTISHITANWITVKNMLDFGTKLGIDCIKFQPIFDDGYASRNAPELLLSNHDVENLLEIASKIDTFRHLPTNPAGFWRDVAYKSGGGELPACNCSLNSSDSISVSGNLSMCYWVNSSSYGKSSEIIDKNELIKIQKNFMKEKQKCKVDFHCFCNQGIDHVWIK